MKTFERTYQDDRLKQLKGAKTTDETLLIRGELIALDSFLDFLNKNITVGEMAMAKLQKQVSSDSE